MDTVLYNMPQTPISANDQETRPNIDIPGREMYHLKWGIYIDVTYCKSIHGILNAALTVVSLVGWVFALNGVISRDCGTGYGFYEFVSGSVFITGLISYVFSSIVIHQNIRFKFVPCKVKDMIWYSVWSVLYFIASVMVALDVCGQSEIDAATVLGFTAHALCIAKVVYSYKAWRHEHRCPHPGDRADSYSQQTRIKEVIVLQSINL
ncbi:uncharacterized protein LOC124133697 [Haliotis rufescens]|uniref:uncharacterized protein LOC124133697 n=1 Tax=Haliotis rufescens TaxID=6454 RepID=UPI00201F36AE|nr:uncharacterized protein LOC124133697 [Haliotis rufescens]